MECCNTGNRERMNGCASHTHTHTGRETHTRGHGQTRLDSAHGYGIKAWPCLHHFLDRAQWKSSAAMMICVIALSATMKSVKASSQVAWSSCVRVCA